MKKFISISLSLLLILSTVLCGISVNAAEDTVADTVTYKFLLTTDTDISAFQGYVSYPTDKLAIASEEDIVVYDGGTGSAVANDIKASGKVLFNASDSKAVYSFDDTALMTITFTVIAEDFDPKTVTTTIEEIYDPAHVLSGNIPYNYKNVVDDVTVLSGYVDLDNDESYVDPTETTEPTTETTEPTTESSEPTTESSEPTTESTEPTTESSEPTTESTEPTTESVEPTTEPVAFDYYVVGSPELFGANWAEDPANGMTKGDDEIYHLTIKNAPAGTFNFKVKDSNGGWHPDGMGNDGSVTTTGGETVIFSYDPSVGFAIVSVDGEIPTYPATTAPTDVTMPTETEPKPTETEPTECDHATTKTVGAKSATYFAKGNTGDKVCAVCGEVIEKGRTIAAKKLQTPKVTVKPAKKAIKVTYKKVKDAKGFKVTYKLGKKTYNEKFTLSKKELKKAKLTKTIKVKKSGKYKVTVKAFVTSGKKIAYSKPTSATTVKIK